MIARHDSLLLRSDTGDFSRDAGQHGFIVLHETNRKVGFGCYRLFGGRRHDRVRKILTGYANRRSFIERYPKDAGEMLVIDPS